MRAAILFPIIHVDEITSGQYQEHSPQLSCLHKGTSWHRGTWRWHGCHQHQCCRSPVACGVQHQPHDCYYLPTSKRQLTGVCDNCTGRHRGHCETQQRLQARLVIFTASSTTIRCWGLVGQSIVPINTLTTTRICRSASSHLEKVAGHWGRMWYKESPWKMTA